MTTAKKKTAKKTTPAPAPVVVRRAPQSPRLIDAAREELRARGLPVELVRIRDVRPGVVELDTTPRPALNPPRR